MQLVRHRSTQAAELLLLNRPDKRNALDVELSETLRRAVLDCADRPRPLVIRSNRPGMFVAGADVEQLRRRTAEESLGRRNARLFQTVAEHPWPTIAVVDGAALGGGCELALACDLRVSTPEAWWGLPETRLGIVPSAGGLTRLTELVGAGCARDLVFSGRRIRGTQAERLGLVQRLSAPAGKVSDDLDGEASTDRTTAPVAPSLDELVEELLSDLGAASMFAVRLAKEAMQVTGDRHRLVDATAQALCLAQPDTQQRLAALMQRRHR